MIHHVGCTLGGHPVKLICRDNGMNPLGLPEPGHVAGCPAGHDPTQECLPSKDSWAVATTRMDVDIPAGPQPTQPGPLHAVVRGPGGLDITLSAELVMFGRLLGAIGAALEVAADD